MLYHRYNPCTLLFLGISEEKLQKELASYGYPMVLSSRFSLCRVEFKLPHSVDYNSFLSSISHQFSDYLIAINEDNLSQILATQLIECSETIATAESCTAGKIAAELASIPGSSAYLMEAYVVYSNQAKTRLCSVSPELIEGHGAVSAEVALALADGARQRAGTDWAVSVTGIAGPGGGSPEKPVGTVYIGCSGSNRTVERLFLFSGDREEVRRQTMEQAIVLLLSELRLKMKN